MADARRPHPLVDATEPNLLDETFGFRTHIPDSTTDDRNAVHTLGLYRTGHTSYKGILSDTAIPQR